MTDRPDIGLNEECAWVCRLPFVSEQRLDLDSRDNTEGQILMQRGRHRAPASKDFEDAKRRTTETASLNGESPVRWSDLNSLERGDNFDFGVLCESR